MKNLYIILCFSTLILCIYFFSKFLNFLFNFIRPRFLCICKNVLYDVCSCFYYVYISLFYLFHCILCICKWLHPSSRIHHPSSRILKKKMRNEFYQSNHIFHLYLHIFIYYYINNKYLKIYFIL